jgi:hypothetical protein
VSTRTLPKLRYIDGHEPSLWLRNELAAVRRMITDGTFTDCGHLLGAMSAAAALWRPGHVVCADCVVALRLYGDADRTCDRCQTVMPPGALIHPCAIRVSSVLLVTFGLCPTCNRREIGQ